MASYRIEVPATAEKQIRKLGKADQLRVLRAVQTLAADPYPAGARRLHGYEDVFRIRVGTFRILYSVAARVLVVIVLKVGHRKDLYR